MKKLPDRVGYRVNLTLPGEVIAVLDRIGKLAGTPRATIIREWLEQAAPSMAEMATAMEMAKGQETEALGMLAKVAGEVSSEVHQLELDVRAQRRRAMRRRKKPQ